MDVFGVLDDDGSRIRLEMGWGNRRGGRRKTGAPAVCHRKCKQGTVPKVWTTREDLTKESEVTEEKSRTGLRGDFIEEGLVEEGVRGHQEKTKRKQKEEEKEERGGGKRRSL